MAPDATTHHSDMCQRYHQLVVTSSDGNTLKVRTPANDRVLPSGFYMGFALTNTGVPADAVWLHLLP